MNEKLEYWLANVIRFIILQFQVRFIVLGVDAIFSLKTTGYPFVVICYPNESLNKICTIWKASRSTWLISISNHNLPMVKKSTACQLSKIVLDCDCYSGIRFQSNMDYQARFGLKTNIKLTVDITDPKRAHLCSKLVQIL